MDPDLSACWCQHVRWHHCDVSAVLDADERYTLVGELRISDARSLGFGVRHSPTGQMLLKCAHASVEWPSDKVNPKTGQPGDSVRKALKYDLSRQFRYVHGTLPPPPEGALRGKA
jgi:hypothetical protein